MARLSRLDAEGRDETVTFEMGGQRVEVVDFNAAAERRIGLLN